MSSTTDSACVQLGNVSIMLSLYWSPMDSDFFVYTLLCPALKKHSILFLLHLRNTFQLFICIKHPLYCVPHLLHKLFMCSSSCVRFQGICFISHNLYTTSEMKEWAVWQPVFQWELIMTQWDYLFFCPIFCVHLTWQSNVIPAALLALTRVKYVPSPHTLQLYVFVW